jgi:hypothetical protein
MSAVTVQVWRFGGVDNQPEVTIGRRRSSYHRRWRGPDGRVAPHVVGSPRQPEPMGYVGGRFGQAWGEQSAIGADKGYLESAGRSRP